MPNITPDNDAFGHEIWAYHTEGHGNEIVERDDGLITSSDGPTRYFAEFSRWASRERRAMQFVQGTRALDIGCGAGRVSLYLQREGMKVTAIDSSPLAIRVCRQRGVADARLLPIEQLGRLPTDSFDTVVMFGNNFGLFGNRKKARRLLRHLYRITSASAVILAESLNPYRTTLPAHVRYRRRNRERGRMGGQIRIRIRFQEIKGPWFEYLLASPAEMRQIVGGTGWQVRKILHDQGHLYVAVIRKI